jgi:hypothetical protein
LALVRLGDEAVGRDSSPIVDGRAVSVADDAIRVGVQRVTVVRLQEVHDLVAELHDAHEPWAKARVLCGVRGSLHTPRVAHDGRLSRISETWLLRGAAAGSSSPHAIRGVVRNLPTVVAGGALHPPIALTIMNPQGGPEGGGIGHVPVPSSPSDASFFEDP